MSVLIVTPAFTKSTITAGRHCPQPTPVAVDTQFAAVLGNAAAVSPCTLQTLYVHDGVPHVAVLRHVAVKLAAGHVNADCQPQAKVQTPPVNEAAGADDSRLSLKSSCVNNPALASCERGPVRKAVCRSNTRSAGRGATA